MPIYTYRCPSCFKDFDVVRKIADMRQFERCNCGDEAFKILVPAHVSDDLAGYESPTTGRWIEGRRAHVEDLKRSGCRVYEKGETEHFLKNAEQRKKDFDRRVDQTVEKAARDIGLIR
jgi:putative FmdB family regulatory protein